ncbi:MAG: glycosyltransferase [Opitutaceae bacterium]|nr:glycosyltransferase [Cytophagales bacterium]
MEKQILLILFLGYFIFYIAFLAFSISTWLRYKTNIMAENTFLKVSVIISARNEAGEILNLLKSISNQDYPEDRLEIIVINDQSSDNTRKIIENYILNKNLNINILDTTISSSTPKKQALNLGINFSVGELLLFTDADCIFGKSWVKSMCSAFHDKDIDLVFGPIKYSSLNYLEEFLSIEQAALLGSSLSSLKMGIPSMCNGANLAIRRSAFDKVNGFNSNSNIASGDDELLLHKIFKSKKDSVLFLKSRSAIVTTKPVSTIDELANQRKRWAGKWEKYLLKRTKGFALFIFGFHLVWISLFALSLIYTPLLPYFILAFTIKLIFEYVFISHVMNFLGKRINLPAFLFLQGIYSFYVVFFGLVSRGSTYTWKERKLS